MAFAFLFLSNMALKIGNHVEANMHDMRMKRGKTISRRSVIGAWNEG